MYLIITNNPAVADKYQKAARFVDGDVIKVFETVRNAVHKGAKIITHPLSGSIKPNESPYKSVMISNMSGPLNTKSLQIIEDAITILNRLPHKKHNYCESILQDFRIIDLDLITSSECANAHSI